MPTKRQWRARAETAEAQVEKLTDRAHLAERLVTEFRRAVREGNLVSTIQRKPVSIDPKALHKALLNRRRLA